MSCLFPNRIKVNVIEIKSMAASPCSILHLPVVVAKWVTKANLTTPPKSLGPATSFRTGFNFLLWWASQLLIIELWVWRWGLRTGWPSPQDLWQHLEIFLVVIVGTDRSSLASSMSYEEPMTQTINSAGEENPCPRWAVEQMTLGWEKSQATQWQNLAITKHT